MKKFFRGRQYDTDTAKKIAERQNLELGEVGSYIETLYMKKTGEFFIFREMFGPLYEGQKKFQFEPMKFEDAKEWAKEYAPAEVFEQEFTAPDKDHGIMQFSTTLPRRIHAKMKRLATARGMSTSQLITKLIDAQEER